MSKLYHFHVAVVDNHLEFGSTWTDECNSTYEVVLERQNLYVGSSKFSKRKDEIWEHFMSCHVSQSPNTSHKINLFISGNNSFIPNNKAAFLPHLPIWLHFSDSSQFVTNNFIIKMKMAFVSVFYI